MRNEIRANTPLQSGRSSSGLGSCTLSLTLMSSFLISWSEIGLRCLSILGKGSDYVASRSRVKDRATSPFRVKNGGRNQATSPVRVKTGGRNRAATGEPATGPCNAYSGPRLLRAYLKAVIMLLIWVTQLHHRSPRRTCHIRDSATLSAAILPPQVVLGLDQGPDSLFEGLMPRDKLKIVAIIDQELRNVFRQSLDTLPSIILCPESCPPHLYQVTTALRTVIQELTNHKECGIGDLKMTLQRVHFAVPAIVVR